MSGNGVRGLGALLLRRNARTPAHLKIQTEAGVKDLTRTAWEGSKQTFRAAMGHPVELRQMSLSIDGEPLELTLLNIGNPQCVILGDLPDRQRFERLGARLERHPMFPEG